MPYAVISHHHTAPPPPPPPPPSLPPLPSGYWIKSIIAEVTTIANLTSQSTPPSSSSYRYNHPIHHWSYDPSIDVPFLLNLKIQIRRRSKKNTNHGNDKSTTTVPAIYELKHS
nr:zinc-finger homeodomain protein 10-like [Dermatophagoides farinae]